jgi:hypothetical protein
MERKSKIQKFNNLKQNAAEARFGYLDSFTGKVYISPILHFRE